MKRAELPSGEILEFPDDTTDDVIDRVVKRHLGVEAKPSAAKQIAEDAITQSAMNPAEGMSTSQRFMAGAGKAMYDLARGFGQLIPGMVEQQSIREADERDRPLMATGAGTAGHFAGTMIPALTIPGGTMARAALGGAALGLGTPIGQGDVTSGKLLSSAIGAGAGMAGQGLANVIGRVARPVQTIPRGAQAGLVSEAQRMGINLPASTITGNPRLGYIESTLASLPGGSRMEALQRRPHEQLANLVMQQAGGSGLATSANLAGAKQASQSIYKDIAARTMVSMDDKALADLSAAQQWANDIVPDKAKAVENVIGKILNKGDVIPGDEYQALRGVIRRATPRDPQTAVPFDMAKRALDDAFARSASAEDAALKAVTDRRYAVMKAIEPLIPAAEARGGTFTPSGLLGPLGEFSGDAGALAKIGPALRDLPQSGTMPRLYYGGLLGAGAGVGSALSGGDWTDVSKSVGLGIAAPYLANRLLTTPTMQNYLSAGFQNLYAQVTAETLRKGLPAAAMAGALTYRGQQ